MSPLCPAVTGMGGGKVSTWGISPSGVPPDTAILSCSSCVLPHDLKQQELLCLSPLPTWCQLCEVSPCGTPKSCELNVHRTELSSRKLIRRIMMSVPTPTTQPWASLNMQGTSMVCSLQRRTPILRWHNTALEGQGTWIKTSCCNLRALANKLLGTGCHMSSPTVGMAQHHFVDNRNKVNA